MKIALIGASGNVGSFILTEAIERGHLVTAITRHPEKISFHHKLTSKKGDVLNPGELASLLVNQDVVISAFNAFQPGLSSVTAYQQQIKGLNNIIHAVKVSEISRLIVVGGAGSLESHGAKLVDTKTFPVEWREMALAMSESLAILKNENHLAWTFLSPSASLHPGVRTGKFRLGKDELIVNEQGESKISTQDYAVALLNEVEHPAHIGQRFTVGY